MFAPRDPAPRDSAPQVILGIDPGLSRCGYGAIVREGAQARAVAAGVLRTDPSAPLPERLALLQVDLDDLFDAHRPVAVVVERVLFQVNARTAISVGQASGLALAGAARRGIAVTQYSPNEVKLAITGDGAADKAAVQFMVTRLLRLAAAPDPPDVADALALALCHAWRDRVLGAVRATDATDATAGALDTVEPNTRLQARIDAALAKQGGRR